MPKRKKASRSPEKPEKVLDSSFPGEARRARGRPGVLPSEVGGRSYNYRLILGFVWDKLRDPLLKTGSEEEVIRVFTDYARPYTQDFVPALTSLILKVIRDPEFPKRPETQMNFLADSLAARGLVSPRRSRDICEQERNKKVNYIIRQDYYIECSCRYKGPALHGKCPKCGTDKLSANLALQKLICIPET